MRASLNNVTRKRANGTWARPGPAQAGTRPGRDPGPAGTWARPGPGALGKIFFGGLWGGSGPPVCTEINDVQSSKVWKFGK